jgi:hypothetical protein
MARSRWSASSVSLEAAAPCKALIRYHVDNRDTHLDCLLEVFLVGSRAAVQSQEDAGRRIYFSNPLNIQTLLCFTVNHALQQPVRAITVVDRCSCCYRAGGNGPQEMREIGNFGGCPSHTAAALCILRGNPARTPTHQNQAHMWSAASPLAGIADYKFRLSLELTRLAVRLPLSKTVGRETAVMNVPSRTRNQGPALPCLRAAIRSGEELGIPVYLDSSKESPFDQSSMAALPAVAEMGATTATSGSAAESGPAAVKVAVAESAFAANAERRDTVKDCCFPWNGR